MKPYRGKNNGREATLYSRLVMRDDDKLITVANLGWDVRLNATLTRVNEIFRFIQPPDGIVNSGKTLALIN